MTVKEQAMLSLQQLPADATWSDVFERMQMLAAIDKGLQDVDAGRVVSHEEVKKHLREWLGR